MNPPPKLPDWFPQNAHLRHIATQQSLTQALSGLGAVFSVRVLFLGAQDTQSIVYPRILSGNLFLREVHLCLNDVPVVWAQSVCTADSIWQHVLDCGNAPLGKVLFNNSIPHLERSQITFSPPSESFLFSRHSWFRQNQEYLYLSECFLTDVQHFV